MQSVKHLSAVRIQRLQRPNKKTVSGHDETIANVVFIAVVVGSAAIVVKWLPLTILNNAPEGLRDLGQISLA